MHNKSHAISSTTDHTATNWSIFHSNGSGQVQEVALPALGAPLLGGGAAAAPAFGALLMANAVVNAAGATPADSDVSAWGEKTWGIVKGTGGRIWRAYKNGVDVYFVEMSAI